MRPASSRDVPPPPGQVSTGVRWLDSILRGGLPARRAHLLVGQPGTGKTTLGLQFLLEGKRLGEKTLFVTLAETREELTSTGRSHGMDLEGIEIAEAIPAEERGRPEQDYTALYPAEIELGESLERIIETVERVSPARVVIDSLAEIRLMAREAVRYRRQIIALKSMLVQKGCTSLFLDTPSGTVDTQLQTICHGVISFEHSSPEYGQQRRRMQVLKMRGVDFHTGYHDFAIRRGGLVVWPRLVAAEHDRRYEREPVASGLAELDTMLGGGPERGTTLLLAGPSGCGKSTLAQQYCMAAGDRREYCAWFTFDERPATLHQRAAAVGWDLDKLIADGQFSLEPVDPGSLSPGEFINRVRRHVEEHDAKIVIIDSLNGYLNAMPGERYLMIHMHELLSYLAQMGVLSVLIIAQPGILSTTVEAPLDMSYLADTILLLRYFEFGGEVRKCLAVVKKRAGAHERAIREFEIGPEGVRVGQPLRHFHGVLTGEPRYIGDPAPLLQGDEHAPGRTRD